MESMSPHGGSHADPLIEFRLVVEDVLDSAEAVGGVEAIEQKLERALAILRDNPDLRPRFEVELVSLVREIREGVVELISFTMHELRWSTIEAEVKARTVDPAGRVSDLRHYEAMLDSFSDDWRDRDLYRRFSS